MQKTQIFYAATCPTCGNTPYAPYRVYDAHGKIIQGCVDEFHTGHLTPISASASWHARPAAKKIRAQDKAMRMGGVTHFARSTL